MKRLIVSLLMAFLSSNVWAQRIVKGGGLAEMQVLYYHQNLGAYLKPCMVRPALCPLSTWAREGLERLVQLEAREVAEIKIQFVSTEGLLRPFVTERRLGADIQFDSRALYDLDGQPLPDAQIAVLVLAARWSHLDTQQPIERLMQEAQKIFEGLSVDRRSTRVRPADTTLSLHDQSLRFLSQSERTLLLEDNASTSDLTPKVIEALPCGELREWQFENWRAAWEGEARVAFFADAFHPTCSGATGRHRLYIQVSVEDKVRFLRESIQVSLRPIF